MSTATEEGISVVIPVKGLAPYLAEALDSALTQTLMPREVVVVDDGSEQRTREVAAQYGPSVRCFTRPRPGSAAALNAGVAASAGSLTAFLDADDIWDRRKLELQAAALDDDPDLSLVFCEMEEFLSPELDEEQRARLASPRRGPATVKSALLTRKRVFERVGGFDEKLTLTDFLDWYARTQEAGLRYRILPQALLNRRLHPGNWGRRADRVEYARTLAAILRRRRAGAEA